VPITHTPEASALTRRFTMTTPDTNEPRSYRCRHIFTDGHQCGSPALRGEKLCFYHHASRRPAQHETIHGLTFVVLPAPEDLHAIQRGLCEVLRLCASNAIDDKHASVLIRGLSIASANLARIARQQKNAPAITELVQDFIHDPVLGTLATGPEPEPAAAALPDNAPILTPKPVIQYIRTPEQEAVSNANWAKAEAELAAHAAKHPPFADPIKVQTYPSSNEDFGLQEKTNRATPPPTPLLRVKEKKQVLHFAKNAKAAGNAKKVEASTVPSALLSPVHATQQPAMRQ